MRRVVSDQIRALKELAALVSESGAVYDIAEPEAIAATSAATTGTTIRRELAPPRAVEPMREAEARSPRESPFAAAAAAETISSSADAFQPPPGGVQRPMATLAEAADPTWQDPRATDPPRADAPFERASPSPVGDRAQAGWLSNLLAAASRDEPDAVVLKGTETLEALTQSIDGLIDNAAAVEMWDRWRRGDSAAVSRRLYTEAGQQAFDDIRRRYRADSQFRETAARYTQEFERLLAKVSQNDRDGSQWRAYLLSNTGKVYTILAHASGRLG